MAAYRSHDEAVAAAVAAAAAAAAPVWPTTAIATEQLNIVDVPTEMRIIPQR